MDKLNTALLKRRPDVFKSYFKRINNITVTNEDIRMLIPERYINKEFIFMGSNTRVLGVYALLDDNNNYCVVTTPIFQDVNPVNITDIMVNNELYKVLHFHKDDVFISNNIMVKSDNFIYDMFDEFYIKGNIPFFLNGDDVSDLFLEADKYAGSNVGRNPLTFEILTAVISRDPKDNAEFIRRKIKKESDKTELNPVYVGLNNIYYSFDNTAARTIGGYYGSGVVTAIVNPETSPTIVADLLRA